MISCQINRTHLQKHNSSTIVRGTPRDAGRYVVNFQDEYKKFEGNKSLRLMLLSFILEWLEDNKKFKSRNAMLKIELKILEEIGNQLFLI